MNNLMIFKNEEFGEIRSFEINNEPYFIGKEIAILLGYKNGSRDINRHVDDEDRRVVPFRYHLGNTRHNCNKREWII
nr:MAG TPA: antirepressor [Caudoviricetes sp.]